MRQLLPSWVLMAGHSTLTVPDMCSLPSCSQLYKLVVNCLLNLVRTPESNLSVLYVYLTNRCCTFKVIIMTFSFVGLP